MKYRKKSTLVEATQWVENGDHPEDESKPIEGSTQLTEGKVVRYFPEDAIPADPYCPECGNLMERHGFLPDGRDGEQAICPGDYVVTDRNGFHYRMSRGAFESVYELWSPPPRAKRELPIPDLEQRKRNRTHREIPLDRKL